MAYRAEDTARSWPVGHPTASGMALVTLHQLHKECCYDTRFGDAIYVRIAILGSRTRDAIRIAILDYRVNQCLYLLFSMRTCNAI